MATKMKGLFKGLKYIGQIFDEENKDDGEIQIGLPTDVKHVAHIGWDGPSPAAADANPSWMKEFKSEHAGLSQSSPLDSNGNTTEKPGIKCVSEDSTKESRATDSTGRGLPEIPRSSRRHSSSDNNNNNSTESPKKKDSSTRSRHSRRSHSKDASDGSLKLGCVSEESGQPSSPSRAHADLAKKTRRKKSKDTEGGTTRSRSKDTEGGPMRSRAKDPEGVGASSRSKSKTAPCGNACRDSDSGAGPLGS